MFLQSKVSFFLVAFQVIFLINFTHAKDNYEIGKRKNLFKVHHVQVEGLKKVEPIAVLEKVQIKKGMILDNQLLRSDIQRIYSMKFFESVEAHHRVKKGKNYLIFKLKEKPIISKISFDGNDEIDDDDLFSQVKTKEFSIVDINSIKADIVALQKHYEEKGFYLASINYKIKKVNNENIELVYTIKEFDKVRVKKITFLGNRIFNDIQLKDIMETREEGFFSFMTGSGNFKEFNFQTDIEKLKYFYKTKGHLQVNVSSPEITVSEDKKWVFISIKITEGPKFSVNEILFDGEIIFPEKELREQMQLRANNDYSEEKLRRDIIMLTEKYQDQGYAFANVLRNLEIVPGENKVNVFFSFEKGKIVHFGKITVKGNSKTRDKVVRRELKIREGMKYSGSALRESRDNVNRLGFFEPGSVLFNTVSPRGKDNVLDVEIQLKERNTGQVNVGAGYSTATKGFLQASVSQNNFRGLGQTLSLSLSLSTGNQTYNLGFTEPYLYDTRWTAGADIFRTRSTNDPANQFTNEGFDTTVGYPIFEYSKLFMTYKYEDYEVFASEDPLVNEEFDSGLISSITSSIVKDKRNNKFEPTSGYYTSLSLSYAGLGGKHKYFRSEVDGRYYKKVIGDLVLRGRLNVARVNRVDGKQVPQGKKFALGGARNMRGFGYNMVGPLACYKADTIATENPQECTGSAFENKRYVNRRGILSIYSTLEFEHPLVREAGLKWVLFTDVGNVFTKTFGSEGNKTLRADYGFGVRWFSPIGVLRFEFGYPYNPRENEAKNQFFFDIGQLF